jgi:hypothetical protein
MRDEEKTRKGAVKKPEPEQYQAPKVQTLTSTQLLEQIGPAQGYGCGGRRGGGRRGSHGWR